MIYKDIKDLFTSPNLDIGCNIEQAYAKRQCKLCGEAILKGEYHLATYHQRPHQEYTSRKNVCFICGLPQLIKRRDDCTQLVTAIKEYLSININIKNRRILKEMQEGTYKKEDTPNESGIL